MNMTATKEDIKQTIAYAKLLLSKEAPVNTIENQLESGIAEIRSLVGEVLEYESTGRLSPILAKAHKMLTIKGIDSALATDIVQSIEIDSTSTKEEICKQLSQQLVRRMPRVVPPPSRESLNSIVIALVGPTGVGKTTTIAKLATKFRLQQGRSVALITADTYRVAAVEQLQQYANLFDSTLAIAGTSQQMSEAIASCNSADIVPLCTLLIEGNVPSTRSGFQESSHFCMKSIHQEEPFLRLGFRR